MSFNLKSAKAQKGSPKPYEKYLREDAMPPPKKANDKITEKALGDRDNKEERTIAKQIVGEHTAKNDEQVVEGALNGIKSWYPHRTKKSFGSDLQVPLINSLVARLRNARNTEYNVEQKKADWTTKKPTQNKGLPEWPKQPAQHEKIVLNDDQRRFDGESPTPLVGRVTKAQVNALAAAIKTGASLDYDNAIKAILVTADQGKRELTEEERKLIQDLKIDRTRALLGYLNDMAEESD